MKKYFLRKRNPRECLTCETRLPARTMRCSECQGTNIHTPPLTSEFEKKNFKGNYARDPNKYAHIANIIDAQPRKPVLKMFPEGCLPINPNTPEHIAEVLNYLFPDISDGSSELRKLNVVCSDALINGIIQWWCAKWRTG